MYQIRKFLIFLNVDWAKNLKPPAEPNYFPKKITKDDIDLSLSYFEGSKFFKLIKAVIFLGAISVKCSRYRY